MEQKHAQPPDIEKSSKQRSPRRALLVCGLTIAMLVGWLQYRSLASVRDTHNTALAQLHQMQNDAAQIVKLREAPQQAVSRTRANEELLAQVEKSLSAAGIKHDNWHDSIPQPPRRIPQSDYKEHTTRLYFHGVTLKQLATFVHHLETSDSTLRVSALNLTNRKPDQAEFDIDLAVSYLVYAREAEEPRD